jgi:hypothetical protein
MGKSTQPVQLSLSLQILILFPSRFHGKKEQLLGSLLSDKFVTRQEEGWERRAASHYNIKGEVKE